MPVNINIQSRERIYINPSNGRRIPRLQKGIVKTNNVGELTEEMGLPEGNGTNPENKAG